MSPSSNRQRLHGLSRVLALGVVVASTLAPACDRGETPPEDAQGAPSGTAAPAPQPAPCTFSRVSRSLVTLNLESADGSCAIVLPAEGGAGTFEVSVAVASREGVASVQLPSPDGDGFLYANEGTVTVTSLDERGVRGRFVATDSNPPHTGGPFAGEFDVAFRP